MANPVKVQTATTPNSLKIMSDAEMDYIAQIILADFASTDTGVGTLSIDPVSTTGLTSVGVWGDTRWDVAPGGQLNSYVPQYQGAFTSNFTSANYTTNFQRFFGGFSGGFFTSPNYTTDFTSQNYTQNFASPVSYAVMTNYGANNYVSSEDQLTTVSNTVYQDLRTASETLTRPLEYDSGENKIIAQIDATLNASVMDHTLDRLGAFGMGSYKLQETTPVSGGTWVSKGSVTDTSDDPTNTYHLWRRTTQTAPTTIRPLKHRLNGNIYDAIEMTDTDIETLTDRFRNRIVATEIGTYALQDTAPGVGTWTRAGEEIDDTRSNTFTGSYVPGYSTNFTSPNYTTDFTSANYTTDFTSPNYTTSFTSPNYTTNFQGFYTSPNYTSSFQRFFGGFSGGFFSSPNYTTNFTAGSFTSPNYTTNFTSPNYTTDFTSANYTTDFTSPNYTSQYASTYASLTQNYSGTYISGTVGTAKSTSLWIRTA